MTASRIVLDGMVPVLMQTPPTIIGRSTIAARLCSFAAAIAAFCPAGPEPITNRSYCSMTCPLARRLVHRPGASSHSAVTVG